MVLFFLNLRIGDIFFRKLYCLYGFLLKMYGLYGFFFENCTDCTDFFSKIVRIVRIASENVRIFSKKKFWPPCNVFLATFRIFFISTQPKIAQCPKLPK